VTGPAGLRPSRDGWWPRRGRWNAPGSPARCTTCWPTGFSLVATYAGALEYRPDSPPEQLSRAAGVVRDGVHQALSELREVINVLRDEQPPVMTRPPRRSLGWPTSHAWWRKSQDAGQQVQVDNRVADVAVVPAAAGRAAYRVRQGRTHERAQACGRPAGPGGARRPAWHDAHHRHPQPAVREAPAPPTVPGAGAGLVGLD